MAIEHPIYISPLHGVVSAYLPSFRPLSPPSPPSTSTPPSPHNASPNHLSSSLITAIAMPTPFETALAAIDAAHALDPTLTTTTPPIPYELHYAQKCTAYMHKLTSTPSDALQLAIRAQHLRRWEVPRSTYPATRSGYLLWRAGLKKRQSEQAAQICVDSGIDEKTAARVAALVKKEGLGKEGEEEVQVLEDVACLVFLDDQFEGFEKEIKEEEKVLGILRKTWAKMGEGGRRVALEMEMGERTRELVGKALEGS